MSLIIEGPTPSHWLEKKKSGSGGTIDGRAPRSKGISLALINNMPDAALEDTELQFFELLDAAAGALPVYIQLYSLTGVPRTERGTRHLNAFYRPFDDLWQSRFDGVIITGTEPHHPTLREEPYWGLLAQVFDWAERNTNSAVLSCLAAHASVLHGDGVGRHRLPDKQFGVFDSAKRSDHSLTRQIADQMRFPHSRWNEVRADELRSCGYTILTESAQAGVDLFVKKKKDSLFVHFQGHPEYGAQTLLKEYRRDIKRFIRGERETYPTMPANYFDAEATKLLSGFQKSVVANRQEQMIEQFPESGVVRGLQNGWQHSAISVYCNWLQYLSQKKIAAPCFAVGAPLAPARSVIVESETA
jgi:homoserine O-succinyltransferase/O-acetyltransferase